MKVKKRNIIEIIINKTIINNLGKAPKRIKTEFGIDVEVFSTLKPNESPIKFRGYEPSLDIKKEITQIIKEEMEFTKEDVIFIAHPSSVYNFHEVKEE